MRQPGRLYLQPVIAGIASRGVGGDINIEKYNGRTPAAVAANYAFRICVVFVIALMALGNSDFHRPKMAVPFSLALILLLGGLTLYQYRDVLGSARDIGFWWIFAFAGVLFFTLLGLAGLSPRLARIRALRPFPQWREEAYFAYVSDLVNNRVPATAEVRELRAALHAGEADGTLVLADRMYLEERLASIARRERALSTQAKAVLRSMVGRDDASAFYFPARMAAAFAISLFTVAFFAVGFATQAYKLKLFAQTVRPKTRRPAALAAPIAARADPPPRTAAPPTRPSNQRSNACRPFPWAAGQKRSCTLWNTHTPGSWRRPLPPPWGMPPYQPADSPPPRGRSATGPRRNRPPRTWDRTWPPRQPTSSDARKISDASIV